MKNFLLIFSALICVLFVHGQDNVLIQAKNLADEGKSRKAIELLDAALREKPYNASLYRSKAVIQLNSKKYDEGFSTMSLAIKMLPDSCSLYLTRGNMHEAFRRYEEAIKDYSTGQQCATDDELKCTFLSNRGSAKAKIRNFQGAYKDLKRAVQYDSTSIYALNNLALVCDEVNRPEETLIYLKQVIAADSNFVPAYVNIGFKYQIMERHEEAIPYFDKAISLEPEQALGYSNRSFSKLKTGDLKGAMKDINYSIKLLPSNSYAYKIRALIYIEKGQTKKACKDLAEASERGYLKQYGSEVVELSSKYCH